MPAHEVEFPADSSNHGDRVDQGGDDSDAGARLMAQAHWLGLLLMHLTGPAVRARVEIDDLVQETLLRAVAAPGGLPAPEESEASLRRLLAHIARNCVMDVLRKMRALKRAGREVRLRRADWSATGLGSGLGSSQLAAPGDGPATLAGLADDQRALMQAYARLSAEHRRVIGLRQFEGLDAREAGRRMGRSESAVHSLYRRALAAWNQALA